MVQDIETNNVGDNATLEDGVVTGYNPDNKEEAFGSDWEFYLSCIGFAVGFGNVWRFPYMLYSLGGACFLIPYLVCFLLIAVPLFLIETAYGQLVDAKLHTRWAIIVPRLWGVSVVQLFVCFFTVVYYVTLMAWSWSFFFASFTSDLPWVLESAAEGTEVSDLWNEDYFMKEVLEKTDNITIQGGIVGNLLWCLILSYIVTYFSCWKGIHSTGKIVYVTCIAPYVILTVLLIKGLTLEGFGKGLNFLFKPDWSKVADTNIWRKAATQILFSSGVAYGPFIYYGSARGRNRNLVQASFWVPLTNSATSLYASLTVFSFLGHVATTRGLELEEVVTSGPTLLFVAFPAFIGMFGGGVAVFFSIIFFFLCVNLGIDSTFGFFDYYVAIIHSAFPLFSKKVG